MGNRQGLDPLPGSLYDLFVFILFDHLLQKLEVFCLIDKFDSDLWIGMQILGNKQI